MAERPHLSRRAARRLAARPPERPGPARPAAVDPRVRYAVLPLRLFLGVTFLYAGLQKVADPGFLHPGSRTYIGAQMQGFAAHSPIGFFLTGVAIPLAQLTGVGVILTELLVGAAVTLGVFTRWAAAAGALLNFVLFLTASWAVQPYFLGSDSIYVVAWITLALAGDGGMLTLRDRLPRGAGPSAARSPAKEASRREFLFRLGLAGAGLVWLLAVWPRGSSAPIARVSRARSITGGTTSSAATAGSGGQPVGSASQLQAQGSLNYTDPRTGDPAVVVGLGGGQLAAYDAVCTHAGCTVQYDPSSRLLICPCHGAEYDPAHGAAVVAGPAPAPLTGLHVAVRNGEVYALD